MDLLIELYPAFLVHKNFKGDLIISRKYKINQPTKIVVFIILSLLYGLSYSSLLFLISLIVIKDLTYRNIWIEDLIVTSLLVGNYIGYNNKYLLIHLIISFILYSNINTIHKILYNNGKLIASGDILLLIAMSPLNLTADFTITNIMIYIVLSFMYSISYVTLYKRQSSTINFGKINIPLSPVILLFFFIFTDL